MEARLRMTSKCNLNCKYCFAKEFRSNSSGDISVENLKVLIDKFKEAGISTLKIQGGEPTCHKEFLQISRKLKESGFSLHLYTNGIFVISTNKDIAECYKSIIINCNQLSEQEMTIISNNIEALLEQGCSIMLGKTISSDTNDIDGFIEFAEKFKSNVRVRLDASRPYIYDKSAFDSFKENASKIIDTLIKVKLHGFDVEIDCCYPPCFFSEGEWKLLRRHLRGFWSKCTTIVDISPDLKVTTCFCGTQFSDLTIYDFVSLEEANLFAEYIENRMRFEVPSDEKCIDCNFRKKSICQGGCLGHKNTELRYAGYEALTQFRKYYDDLKKSGANEIMESVFSFATKLSLLSSYEVPAETIEEICESEINKEADNPFVYVYLANSILNLNNNKLVFKILNQMPSIDEEANKLKEKILKTIGVFENEK